LPHRGDVTDGSRPERQLTAQVDVRGSRSIRRVSARPTRDDVDALVGPATPHFAYQLRARVHELVADLPPDDDVRRYAEEQMALLDRLGHASSKAEEGPREPRTRPGWKEIPSAAPADSPLPPRA
jgi:hypothetical protein